MALANYLVSKGGDNIFDRWNEHPLRLRFSSARPSTAGLSWNPTGRCQSRSHNWSRQRSCPTKRPCHSRTWTLSLQRHEELLKWNKIKGEYVNNITFDSQEVVGPDLDLIGWSQRNAKSHQKEGAIKHELAHCAKCNQLLGQAKSLLVGAFADHRLVSHYSYLARMLTAYTYTYFFRLILPIFIIPYDNNFVTWLQ